MGAVDVGGDDILLLSGESLDALRAQAQMVLKELDGAAPFHAVCGKVARQPRHPHRAALLAADAREAKTALTAFLGGDADAPGVGADGVNVFVGHAPAAGLLSVTLLVCDIGAEWFECGFWLRQLGGPAYAAAVAALAVVGLPDPSAALDAPRAETEGQVSVAVNHAALFVYEMTLLDILRRLGLRFDRVASFSMGEPQGAVACGALSVGEGATALAAMSGCIQAIEGQGAMFVVFGLSHEELEAEAELFDLEVGAVFSEKGGCLTGSLGGVAALSARLHGDLRVQFMKRPLCCRAAYHSKQLEGAEPRLRRHLGPLAAGGPAPEACGASLPWYTSVTGGREAAPAASARDPAWWFRGLRGRARSQQAIEALVADAGEQAFVELNARSMLARTAAEAARTAGVRCPLASPVTSLDSGLPAARQLLQLACRLHCAGAAVATAR